MKLSKGKKQQKNPEIGDLIRMPYSMIPTRVFMVVHQMEGFHGREFVLLDNSGRLVSINESVIMCTLNLEDEM